MTLTIGIVSKKSGIGIETIRFYERKGLIKPPPRNGSGYRVYPEDTIKRLQFVRNAKVLGFTLTEISSLLSLRLSSQSKCKRVRKRTEEKISNIEDKIKSLQKMCRALKKLIHTCESNSLSSECPILEVLENG